MLEFFTKLFTPVFITLGLVNPSPVIPEQPQPIVQQEIVQEEAIFEIVEEPIIEEETEEVIPETVKETLIISQQPVVSVIQEPVIIPEPVIEVTVPEIKPEVVVQETPEELDPECGTAKRQDFEIAPTENLCATGTATEVIQSDIDEFTWSCETEKDDVSCKAYRKVNGECGVPTGAILESNFEHDQLCSEGEKSSVNSQNGTLTWRCNGARDAIDVQCSAFVKQHGSCGSTAGTCSKGNPINVVNSGNTGKTTWQCTGANGGYDKSCSKTTTSSSSSGSGNNTNPLEGCSCTTGGSLIIAPTCTGTNTQGQDCSQLFN